MFEGGEKSVIGEDNVTYYFAGTKINFGRKVNTSFRVGQNGRVIKSREKTIVVKRVK